MVNHELTERELNTVKALAFGNASTNKEIAATLNISHRTVESHLRSAMDKLNLKNRIQLITWARENLTLPSNRKIQ